MGLFSGAWTSRRYRVAGDLPDAWRETFENALTDHAFSPPFSASHAGEVTGWVLPDNMLDTDFAERDRWLFNYYLVFTMRTDKKTVPPALFKAQLAKRLKAWCRENGRERCPASVRADIKDGLESEMLAQVLPRTKLTELCWNLADGWVVVHSTSEPVNDRVRKIFLMTFGLTLLPWSPLDFLEDRPELAAALEVQGTTTLRTGGET